MCLSTPTTPSDGNNTTTTCSSSPCTTASTENVTTTNGEVTACGTNVKKQTELDCNGNTTTTVNSIKQRKTAASQNNKNVDDEAQNATLAKDLVDNLGYKEENAVYKECAQAKEKLLQQQQSAEDLEKEFKPKIRWPDLIAQLFLHVGGLYGFYLLFSAKFYTFLWGE